jgi:hypothetical protein
MAAVYPEFRYFPGHRLRSYADGGQARLGSYRPTECRSPSHCLMEYLPIGENGQAMLPADDQNVRTRIQPVSPNG